VIHYRMDYFFFFYLEGIRLNIFNKFLTLIILVIGGLSVNDGKNLNVSVLMI